MFARVQAARVTSLLEIQLQKCPCGRGYGVRLTTHHPQDQPKHGPPPLLTLHWAVQLL